MEAPVIVVSESAARRLWPAGDPVGQTIEIRSEGGKDPYFSRLPAYRTARVIGVVRDVMNGWTDTGRDVDCLYFPTNAEAANNDALLVRSDSRRSIEETLDQVAPSAADFVSRMDVALATQTYPFRIIFWIAAALSALALALTVSGIYGVLSYLVNQRTREIGIRAALGAGTRDVLRLVIAEGLGPTSVGILIGVVGALASGRVMRTLVYGVSAWDPITIGAVSIALIGVSLVASAVPAWRASRVDPLVVLRD